MSWIETSKGAIEIRELVSISEMQMAEEIQQVVWGRDTLPCPKEILIPAQHEGGLLAGAFLNQKLVGLVFAFPTRDPSIQHSHLLATLEELRGLGIGTALKWFQRTWSLDRGIRLLRWTVDPLRVPNADINIRQLGGLCNTYLVNYYGEMQGIDAGAPTDRLLIDWHLNSPRVIERVDNPMIDVGYPDAIYVNDLNGNLLPEIRTKNCPRYLVRLPINFLELTQSQPELADQWRLGTREALIDLFKREYRIVEFTRLGGPAYLLEAK